MGFFDQQVNNDVAVAQAIYSREKEIADYDNHANVLTSILATFADLTDPRPESIQRFIGVTDSMELAKDTTLSPEDQALAGRYQHRDSVQRDLNMNITERAKANAILEGLATSIPEDRLNAAVVALKATLATA